MDFEQIFDKNYGVWQNLAMFENSNLRKYSKKLISFNIKTFLEIFKKMKGNIQNLVI